MKSTFVDPFDPFARFSTSSKSVRDMASWLKTHKSNADVASWLKTRKVSVDVMADLRSFEERTKYLYDLEYARNEAWYKYAQTAFEIQRQKIDFEQQMSAVWRDLYSEDQASKEQIKEPLKEQKDLSSEAAKTEDLKTVSWTDNNSPGTASSTARATE